jgi:hypothetical protein
MLLVKSTREAGRGLAERLVENDDIENPVRTHESEAA